MKKSSQYINVPFCFIPASAGAVIAGAELNIDVLKSILEAIGDVSRKVAIGIENESRHPWEALNAYFFSGTSHASLSYSVAQVKIC